MVSPLPILSPSFQESVFVLFVVFVQLPEQRTLQGVFDSAARPRKRYKTNMLPVSVEGCCRQGSRGSPFSAISFFSNDCYVGQKLPYEGARRQSEKEVGQDGVSFLEGKPVCQRNVRRVWV